LIQENSGIVDKLVPSINGHFWWRMNLEACKGASVCLCHAAQFDCDRLALGRFHGRGRLRCCQRHGGVEVYPLLHLLLLLHSSRDLRISEKPRLHLPLLLQNSDL
jgi:hypothetical protein